MVKYIIIILNLLLFINSYSETVLRTEFQDTPSKITIDSNGKVGGITMDIIKMIEKNSNYRFKYENSDVTLFRIEDDLLKNRIDIYFGMLKSSEREKDVIFVEPLYDINYIAITAIGNKKEIKTMEDLKKESQKKPVLTIFGSVIGEFLMAQGIKSEAGAKSVDANLQKLISKRADYLVYHDIALYYFIKSSKYKDKFKVLDLTIKKDTLWLVTSKKVDKNTLLDLQIIIKKLKEKDEWKNLMKKYEVKN